MTARTAPETSHSAIEEARRDPERLLLGRAPCGSSRRRTRTPPATRPASGPGARSSLHTPSRCRKPSSANAEQQERHDRGEDLERDRAGVRQQVVVDEGVDVAAHAGADPRTRGRRGVHAPGVPGHGPARLGRRARRSRPALDPPRRLRLDRAAAAQRGGAAGRPVGDRRVAGRQLHRPAVGAQRLRAALAVFLLTAGQPGRPLRPPEAVPDRAGDVLRSPPGCARSRRARAR